MDAVTVTFLVIGGAGIGVLALSLLIGDLFHLGHPDADGPFSLPAVAGFIGAFGFAGAVATEFFPAAFLGCSPRSARVSRPRSWPAVRPKPRR